MAIGQRMGNLVQDGVGDLRCGSVGNEDAAETDGPLVIAAAAENLMPVSPPESPVAQAMFGHELTGQFLGGPLIDVVHNG